MITTNTQAQDNSISPATPTKVNDPNALSSTKWLDTVAYLNKLMETRTDLISITVEYDYYALHKKPWLRVAFTRVLMQFDAFEKRFLNSDVAITLDCAGIDYVRLNAFPVDDHSIVYSGCCSKSHLMETWHDWLCGYVQCSNDPDAQEILRSYPVAANPSNATPDPTATKAEAPSTLTEGGDS